MSGAAVQVMLAAGPYTLDADLNYEPFEALIEAALRDRPDVLVLVSWTLRRVTKATGLTPMSRFSSDRSWTPHTPSLRSAT